MDHKQEFVEEINQLIDIEMIPILYQIWAKSGKTFQCCIANLYNNDDEEEYEENPWIIISKDTLPIIQDILQDNIIEVIDGTNGYAPLEYINPSEPFGTNTDYYYIMIKKEYFL